MSRLISTIFLSASLSMAALADTMSEYEAYREGIKAKRALLSEDSLAAWQPLYNTLYTLLDAQTKGILQLATTAEEIANGKRFLARADQEYRELAECYQVNMAIEFPDASTIDAIRVAKAMEYQTPYLMPTIYETGLAMVTMNCTQSPSQPYTD